MLDSTSLGEKIGIMGLVGGTFVACAQILRFIGRFSQEHQKFMEHIIKAEPMMEDFIKIKESVELAKTERGEIIEELRGLREELRDILKMMINEHNNGT